LDLKKEMKGKQCQGGKMDYPFEVSVLLFKAQKENLMIKSCLFISISVINYKTRKEEITKSTISPLFQNQT
jgi:hypothetical protein